MTLSDKAILVTALVDVALFASIAALVLLGEYHRR